MITGKWFDGFAKSELADINQIKNTVFVKEMGMTRDDVFDEGEFPAVHLAVYDNGKPVACGKIIKDGSRLCFGQIASLPEHRGKGYGDFVMRLLIRKAFDMGAEKQYVNVPVAVRGFFERLGFVPEGDIGEEADIHCIVMVHTGDVGGCKH